MQNEQFITRDMYAPPAKDTHSTQNNTTMHTPYVTPEGASLFDSALATVGKAGTAIKNTASNAAKAIDNTVGGSLRSIGTQVRQAPKKISETFHAKPTAIPMNAMGGMPVEEAKRILREHAAKYGTDSARTYLDVKKLRESNEGNAENDALNKQRYNQLRSAALTYFNTIQTKKGGSLLEKDKHGRYIIDKEAKDLIPSGEAALFNVAKGILAVSNGDSVASTLNIFDKTTNGIRPIKDMGAMAKSLFNKSDTEYNEAQKTAAANEAQRYASEHITDPSTSSKFVMYLESFMSAANANNEVDMKKALQGLKAAAQQAQQSGLQAPVFIGNTCTYNNQVSKDFCVDFFNWLKSKGIFNAAEVEPYIKGDLAVTAKR